MRTIQVGDIIYDTIGEELGEVLYLTKDKFGQPAVVYRVTKHKHLITTAYFVFHYYIKVGTTRLKAKVGGFEQLVEAVKSIDGKPARNKDEV